LVLSWSGVEAPPVLGCNRPAYTFNRHGWVAFADDGGARTQKSASPIRKRRRTLRPWAPGCVPQASHRSALPSDNYKSDTRTLTGLRCAHLLSAGSRFGPIPLRRTTSLATCAMVKCGPMFYGRIKVRTGATSATSSKLKWTTSDSQLGFACFRRSLRRPGFWVIASCCAELAVSFQRSRQSNSRGWPAFR